MSSITPLHGLTAAPFTPFHPDGRLNSSLIPVYARFLRDNGVKSAFVCGTTGEGPSMTVEERLEVAAAWVKSKDEPFRVIVHVGNNCQADAIHLAEHARQIGADAVSALAPFFFKPQGVEDLVSWCATIAEAAAPLPFYYYHMPSFTGVNFPMAGFLAAAKSRIPTLAGIKYTFEDLADYQACLNLDAGWFDVLFGRDELLIEALKVGAKGAVGSTYNYAAPLYLRLIEAFNRGDLKTAAALQKNSVRMIEICNSVGVTHLAASKALMQTLGIDCGPVRLPLRRLTPEQTASLGQQLEALGFSSFACRGGG